MATTDPLPKILEIRKYPNRRFYDVSRSRHVTLNDLHELVEAGSQIRVIDSKSGHDITNVVLTQIILEHDPPKLDLFPASLLHQAIQANEQMVRKFVDTYFAQAVDAFSHSRRQFEEFLKKSGFSALAPTAPFDWVRMLMPGMGGTGVGPMPGASSPFPPPPPTVSESDAVEALKEQVARLSAELDEMRKGSAKTSGKRKGSKPHS
ncbi:MAG: polyhydroxyalkanoate synthesis regulator DNA-binding domain-containing protein [Planctomycetota bacterium]